MSSHFSDASEIANHICTLVYLSSGASKLKQMMCGPILILHYAILCYTTLHYTTLYDTILYDTVLNDTILYDTIITVPQNGYVKRGSNCQITQTPLLSHLKVTFSWNPL